MKTSPKSILSATALLIGGFIGASALVVLASGTSTWSPAPGAPSNCPSGTQGCDAPINVGTGAQIKNGDLGINNLAVYYKSFFAQNVKIGTTTATATIQIVDGNQANGKVLQSDANGNAKWVATSTLGISGGSTGVTGVIAGTGITISPTTGTGAVTINTDNTQVQKRVGSSCASGYAISGINQDGTVACVALQSINITTQKVACSVVGASSAACNVTCPAGFLITSWTCSNGNNAIYYSNTASCSISNYSSIFTGTLTASGSGLCTKQ